MTKLYMFTGNTCVKCKRAKAMLVSVPNENMIDLIEINVDEDPNMLDELKTKYKSNTLPTFVIHDGYPDDKPLVLLGFDENIGKLQEVYGV